MVIGNGSASNGSQEVGSPISRLCYLGFWPTNDFPVHLSFFLSSCIHNHLTTLSVYKSNIDGNNESWIHQWIIWSFNVSMKTWFRVLIVGFHFIRGNVPINYLQIFSPIATPPMKSACLSMWQETWHDFSGFPLSCCHHSIYSLCNCDNTKGMEGDPSSTFLSQNMEIIWKLYWHQIWLLETQPRLYNGSWGEA